jgi:hypothetical protein
VADTSSNIVPNEVPEYYLRKQLTMELIGYISRDIRPRYKEVLNNFYTKYEDSYCHTDGSSAKKSDKAKPKEIKQNLEDTTKKRAEYKKLAKKHEIDSKLKNAKIDEGADVKEPESASQDNDKSCVICYKNNNLYVSK